MASNPVELTVSGRPVLQRGEVEIRSEGGVKVYHGDGKSVALHSCTVTLTIYRLIFVEGSCGVALGLESIQRLEDLTSIFRHSSRFRISYSEAERMELKFVEGLITSSF